MVQQLFLILAILNSAVGDFQLRVLHTNDVHAHVEQSNVHSGRCSAKQAREKRCYGGVARRRTAITALSDIRDNVILLDAGDQFQGTMWFSFYKGREAAYFMNRLGYDVMTLGNHEFDNGVSGLVHPFLEQVRFPVVCCNIETSRAPELAARISNYTVLNVSGELIGVVGYVTKDTAFLATPAGIANIIFLDPIPCIQAVVDELRDQGIKKIIALGHSGFDYSKRVAREVRGVDIVVDGHTNTFLYSGRRPSVEKQKGPYPVVIHHEDDTKTLVYQAYAYGKYLGCADVTFDDNGDVIKWKGNPVLLDARWREDEDMLADVMEWKEPMLNLSETVIATSLVFLEGGHPCEEAECNMGDLITDVMLQYAHVFHGRRDVDIAFINGGAIRAPIQPGPVIIGDLETTLPISNRLKIVSVNASTLRQILEHSVTSKTSSHGHFLQVAGIRVWYNMCLPDGHRVTDVTVFCPMCKVPRYKRLDDDVIYNVITTDYLVAGGDGFRVLSDNILRSYDTGVYLGDLVEASLMEMSVVVQLTEKRIKFLKTSDDCKSEH
ncbi:hypothetical protein LSH36_623g03008 [Paralvinella palmiformis]|uniref:5'-nucleotidase n=1 Tax=Paralvinella palmiformis TaxID=53620 RepID=A0AAD9J4H8_9ANNE|nr:hypothetical protein LSH36_623g03008 [Paralvinella palmiformis]